MSSRVRPEELLKRLEELWATLGGQQNGESTGVLRACAMTLVVAGESSTDDAEVGETLAALMRDHPSRAIVLRLIEGGEPSIEARVLAQCWMPFGRRQQICCEQIEITLTAPSLPDLPPVIRGLTAPDLPLMLWCRSPRLPGDPAFRPLCALADKVILDSEQAADPLALLRDLRADASGVRRFADLAWTRLTSWRQQVAELFENPAHLERLAEFRRALIGYAGARVPMEARYLESWLRRGLPGLECRFERTGEAPTEARRSALVAATLFLADQPHAMTAAGTTTETPGDYELLREELGIPGADPVYENVVKDLLAGAPV